MGNLPNNIQSGSDGSWNTQEDLTFGGFANHNVYRLTVFHWTDTDKYLPKFLIFNKSTSLNKFNFSLKKWLPDYVASTPVGVDEEEEETPGNNPPGPGDTPDPGDIPVEKPVVTLTIKGSINDRYALNATYTVTILGQTMNTYKNFSISKSFNTALTADENDLNNLKTNGVVIRCVNDKNLIMKPSEEVTVQIPQLGTSLIAEYNEFFIEIPSTESKNIQIAGNLSWDNQQPVASVPVSIKFNLYNGVTRQDVTAYTGGMGNYITTVDVTNDIIKGTNYKEIIIKPNYALTAFNPKSIEIPFDSLVFSGDGIAYLPDKNFTMTQTSISVSADSIMLGREGRKIDGGYGYPRIEVISSVVPFTFTIEILKGESWINIMSGPNISRDKGSIEISAKPNPNTSIRKGIIAINCPTYTSSPYEIEVKQQGKLIPSDIVVLPSKDFTTDYLRKTVIFTVQSIKPWEITGFATFLNAFKSNDAKSISVDIYENSSNDQRTGRILLSNGQDYEPIEIHINQQAILISDKLTLKSTPSEWAVVEQVDSNTEIPDSLTFVISADKPLPESIRWSAELIHNPTWAVYNTFSSFTPSNGEIYPSNPTATITVNLEKDDGLFKQTSHSAKLLIRFNSSWVLNNELNIDLNFTKAPYHPKKLEIVDSTFEVDGYDSGSHNFRIDVYDGSIYNQWIAEVVPSNPWITTDQSPHTGSGVLQCSFTEMIDIYTPRTGYVNVTLYGTNIIKVITIKQNGIRNAGSRRTVVEVDKERVSVGKKASTVLACTLHVMGEQGRSPWSATISGDSAFSFTESLDSPVLSRSISGNQPGYIPIYINFTENNSGNFRHCTIIFVPFDSEQTSTNVSVRIEQSAFDDTLDFDIIPKEWPIGNLTTYFYIKYHSSLTYTGNTDWMEITNQSVPRGSEYNYSYKISITKEISGKETIINFVKNDGTVLYSLPIRQPNIKMEISPSEDWSISSISESRTFTVYNSMSDDVFYWTVTCPAWLIINENSSNSYRSSSSSTLRSSCTIRPRRISTTEPFFGDIVFDQIIFGEIKQQKIIRVIQNEIRPTFEVSSTNVTVDKRIVGSDHVYLFKINLLSSTVNLDCIWTYRPHYRPFVNQVTIEPHGSEFYVFASFETVYADTYRLFDLRIVDTLSGFYIDTVITQIKTTALSLNPNYISVKNKTGISSPYLISIGGGVQPFTVNISSSNTGGWVKITDRSTSGFKVSTIQTSSQSRDEMITCVSSDGQTVGLSVHYEYYDPPATVYPYIQARFMSYPYRDPDTVWWSNGEHNIQIQVYDSNSPSSTALLAWKLKFSGYSRGNTSGMISIRTGTPTEYTNTWGYDRQIIVISTNPNRTGADRQVGFTVYQSAGNELTPGHSYSFKINQEG